MNIVNADDKAKLNIEYMMEHIMVGSHIYTQDAMITFCISRTLVNNSQNQTSNKRNNHLCTAAPTLYQRIDEQLRTHIARAFIYYTNINGWALPYTYRGCLCDVIIISI